MRQQEQKLGLEAMAVAFSLPNALFHWRYVSHHLHTTPSELTEQFCIDSMLTFLFAISWVFFYETDLYTRSVLGALFGVIVALVGVVIFLGWKPTPEEDGFKARVSRPLKLRLKKFPNITKTIRWKRRRKGATPSEDTDVEMAWSEAEEHELEDRADSS